MKRKVIKLYNIDELKSVNKKAFDAIIEKTREKYINIRFDSCTLDILEILKDKYNLDVKSYNIYCSISYSQGDGVSFIDDNILSYSRLSKNENLNAFEKWIINNTNENELNAIIEYLNCGYNLSIVKIAYRYCHPYTCAIDNEYYYDDDPEKEININDIINKLCNSLFNNVYVSICHEIEKYLYSYYEVSDEELIQYINDSECYYDADGRQY